MWHKRPIALDPILSKAGSGDSNWEFSRRVEQSPWVLYGHILMYTIHKLSSGQQGTEEGASGLSPIHILQAVHCFLNSCSLSKLSCRFTLTRTELCFVCMSRQNWEERESPPCGWLRPCSPIPHEAVPCILAYEIPSALSCGLVIGVTYHWSLVVCW